jgi:hypothetical protein
MMLSIHGISQDTLHKNGNKINLSFITGPCIKGYMGSAYIDPTTSSYEDPYILHQFEGFTKKPSFGFEAGLMVAFRLSPHWSIATGLSYFLRPSVYENSMDTIINNFESTSYQNINNVVKYQYAWNNLEIPVMVLYNIKNVSIYAGFQFAFFSYRLARYTYVMRDNQGGTGSYTYYTSQKKFGGFETPLRLYPVVQASYDWKIKNFLLKPFISFQFFEINMKTFEFHVQTLSGLHINSSGPDVDNCFYLQLGVIIPLKH